MSTDFADLTEFTDAQSGDEIAVARGSNTGRMPVEKAGAQASTDLSDTPSSLGTTGQVLAVNSGGTALEFTDQSGGGEDNVQADWDEADTTSDAYIQNKPTIPAAPETMYDNTAGTALTRSAGAWSWGNDLQFPLSRALAATDDDKRMVLEIEFTTSRTNPAPATDITRFFSLQISPRQFRMLANNALTAGTTITGATQFIHAHGIRLRDSDPSFGTAARNSIITRQRHTDGHDVLRIILNTDSQSVAISSLFARVMLVG